MGKYFGTDGFRGIQKEGKLFGENTDGKGFVTALKNSGETLDKKNVTILGAGTSV